MTLAMTTAMTTRDTRGDNRRGCSLVMAVAVTALIGLGGRPARAQATPEDEPNFDQLAAGARPVGAWSLAGLLWSRVASCEGAAADDLARRQCAGVRRARQQQLSGQSFLVEGDLRSVEIGEYAPIRLSAPLWIRPCVACAQPIAVDGEAAYIVGPGKWRAESTGIGLAALHETARTFKTVEQYEAWKRDVLPRLHREFIIRLDGASNWKQAGAAGVRVEVLAWRVFDPCSGEIIAASPAADPVAPDRRACGGDASDSDDGSAVHEGEDEAGGSDADADAEPSSPAEPALPTRISPSQINRKMASVRRASLDCHDRYGVAGRSNFRITFNAQGDITEVVHTGDFRGTPTGACIEASIREVHFPAMKQDAMTFDFPVVLK